MKQQIHLGAYFLRYGPKTDFTYMLKYRSSPDELAKFSYLRQIDLKIAKNYRKGQINTQFIKQHVF